MLENREQSFRTSLPGVLIVLATVVTAILGAYSIYRGLAPGPQPAALSRDASRDSEPTGDFPGAPERRAAGPGEDALLGKWSSNRDYGDLTNPLTASREGAMWSGNFYEFYPGGAYRSVICGSGSLLSGCVTTRGEYRVEGARIVFYNNRENWLPDPTRKGQKDAYQDKPGSEDVMSFRFSKRDTLVFDDIVFLQRVR